MRRVKVTLSYEIVEKLKEIQLQRGYLTFSETVRAVLGECLEKEEKEKKLGGGEK